MILSICDSAEVLKVMRIIIIAIKALRIAVPIILIVKLVMDYTKAVTDGDVTSANKGAVPKLIAAVLVFLVPTFVKFTVKLVDVNNEYYKCIENANSEGIHNAQVSEAKQYIINAKNTLRMGNYQIAERAVAKLDSSDREALNSELRKVKTEIEQAQKEREAAAQSAASSRDSQNNSSSSSSSSSGPSGVTVDGKYTKTQIIDMTEDQVRAMSNAEFIDFIGSAAQLIYHEYGGCLPSITIAQACYESGYGNSFESTSFNVYGLHGYPGNKPLVSFLRKFDNFYDATYYHSQYFREYSNVYGNFLVACSNNDAITAAGYLNAYAGGQSNYGSTVQTLIRQYDLTKYDK